MIPMPIKGKRKALIVRTKITTAELEAAIDQAVTKAIGAMLVMQLGDPKWLGAKRGSFRIAELAAIPTASPSMALRLAPGSALVNDGVDYAGNWFHVFANDDERTATFDASHATLDRYDLLVLVPKRTGSGSVPRQTIDSNGNISTASGFDHYYDDFDLQIIKGANGAASRGLTRIDAYEEVAAGLIPIAEVKIRAAATTIINTDIQDLREVYLPRAYPINEDIPANVLAQLGGAIPPVGPGGPYLLKAGGDEDLVSARLFYFNDSTNKMRFKKDENTVYELTMTLVP